MTIISEKEFSSRIRHILTSDPDFQKVNAVTGPGRSGAIAAAYASYILNIPFIPYGQQHQNINGLLLIIDTARQTGKTMNKAEKKYCKNTKIIVVCYEEPPRVTFWYEHV